MTKQINHSLTRLLFSIFMIILIAMAVWTVSPVDDVKAAPDTWAAINPMTTAREYHTSTLLLDGKVLVVGGLNTITLSSAELFNPLTGNWSSTGSLGEARFNHSATMLSDGRVLVVGGQNAGTVLNSVEIFDPTDGTWSTTNPMSVAREMHTATLLLDGKVLVIGGRSGSTYYNSAELYDPTTGTWSPAASKGIQTAGHTATLLPDGRVLVTGGVSSTYWVHAQVYNPASNSWTTPTMMITARAYHTATLLNDGRVLVVGGRGNSGFLSNAEIFNPATYSWSSMASLNTARENHSATLLPNGKVLVAGGFSGSAYLSNAELYDLATNTWSYAASMSSSRVAFTATLLPNGAVLVAGGVGDAGNLSSAELYVPSEGSWADSSTPMNTNRMRHTATLLPDGKVLVAGGNNTTTLNTAEIYDPATETWSYTGPMITGRYYHTATLLANGKVLIMAGYNAFNLKSAELYDPGTATWSATGSMAIPREQHASNLLPDGRVLVTGGWRPGVTAMNGVEIYNPDSGTWSTAASMSSTRYSHSATLLPNGHVLVVGGNGAGGVRRDTTELFDPITNNWIGSGSLTTARAFHTATLLPNGKVLVVGGSDGTNFLTSAEIYDPGTGSWDATASMSEPRLLHTATLLPDGRVLVAGGRTTGDVDLNSAEIYNPALDIWSDPQYFNEAREYDPATLLLDGKVLLAGGYNIGVVSQYNSTELYDPDLGYENAWQPTITSVNSPLGLGEALTVSGTGFRGYGYTEASSGGTQSSATNYPLVQLRHQDSGQTIWLPMSNFNATSFTTIPVSGIHPGPALITVFVNGIPSMSQMITVTPPPVITLSSAIYAVDEDGTNITITAQISGERSGNITVDYATWDGTALAGSDFTATSGTLTFTPADTEMTFTVPVLDDTIYEGDETFNVSLANPTFASLGSPSSAVVTITDDDSLPEIVLSSDTYSVDEGGESVTITAQINGARTMDVTIDYATADGTALAGSDYSATSGTLTLTPTDTEKTFSVPILDDAIFEGDETFIFTLSNPTNATLGTPSEATVTIVDNDEAIADLALTLTDSPDPVFVGQEITYDITIENLGPQDAIAVEVTDTLPVGVEYLSATGTDWSCGESDGVVTCELAALANGASSHLQILVRAPLVAGEITNSTQVSSSIADTNLDNNQATETTIVEMRKIYLPIILR